MGTCPLCWSIVHMLGWGVGAWGPTVAPTRFYDEHIHQCMCVGKECEGLREGARCTQHRSNGNISGFTHTIYVHSSLLEWEVSRWGGYG